MRDAPAANHAAVPARGLDFSTIPRPATGQAGAYPGGAKPVQMDPAGIVHWASAFMDNYEGDDVEAVTAGGKVRVTLCFAEMSADMPCSLMTKSRPRLQRCSTR